MSTNPHESIIIRSENRRRPINNIPRVRMTERFLRSLEAATAATALLGSA